MSDRNFKPAEMPDPGPYPADKDKPPEILAQEKAAFNRIHGIYDDDQINKTAAKSGTTKDVNNNYQGMKRSGETDKKSREPPPQTLASGSDTDFRRFYKGEDGEVHTYNILTHQPYIDLTEQKPYDGGYLMLEFIDRRKSSGLKTAAQNINIPSNINLSECFGFKKPEDFIEKFNCSKADASSALKKMKLLNGRLNCRFRSVYEFRDELLNAFPHSVDKTGDSDETKEKNKKALALRKAKATEIEKALHAWAVRGNGVKGTEIFQKGAQDELLKVFQKIINEVPPEKKKTLQNKFNGKNDSDSDVLTLIEKEMIARRRGYKLPTAALFQDLTCNPGAVVFKQGSAFLVKDGDVFSMVGGREEDWEPLILAAMKYINDKDPWSARPSFTGSPEFVTFAISVCRKHTIRWAQNKETNGTGYTEAFFQFGDQVSSIQQGSPHHHEQGFWDETLIVYDMDKPTGIDPETGEMRYEVMRDENSKPIQTSMVLWDPVVAHAAQKDVDWTCVHNFACNRPSYESGVVRKNFNDVHRQARQGIVLRYITDPTTGKRKIDSDSLMQAKLISIAKDLPEDHPDSYERLNREAFNIDYGGGLEGRTEKERQSYRDAQLALAKTRQNAGGNQSDPKVPPSKQKENEALGEMLQAVAEDKNDDSSPLAKQLIKRLSAALGVNEVSSAMGTSAQLATTRTPPPNSQPQLKQTVAQEMTNG